MIILKVVFLIIGFFAASFWITVLIGAGVKIGLKNYFDKSSKGGN